MSEWTAEEVKDYFLGVIDKNLTQKEIAKSIGISETSLSRFVNGEIGPGERLLDFLCLERVFRYRPTQSHLPFGPLLTNVIPQSKAGTGGRRPLIDRPDSCY